jgi:hypothetical protein
MYRRFLRLIRLVAVILAAGAPVRPSLAGDPAVLLPSGITIGMDRAALRLSRPSLRRLNPPLSFGPVQAEFIDTDVEGLGAPGLLYFQMDARTGRLRQLLFEWRDGRVPGGGLAEMLKRLEADLGAPELVCITTPAGRPPRRVSAQWRGRTVMLRVSMFDYRARNIAYFDPNTDSDPRRPSFERRRITRRSLPRRMVARVHAVDDLELEPRQDCPDGSSLEPR